MNGSSNRVWNLVSKTISKKSVDKTISISTPALTSNSKLPDFDFFGRSIIFIRICSDTIFGLLPKFKPFNELNYQITDTAKLAITQDKLLLLASSELFPNEFEQLQSCLFSKILIFVAEYSLLLVLVALFVPLEG